MQIIQDWGFDPALYDFEPISDGLINDSWKVVPQQGSGILGCLFLQKINREVFLHPESVQANHEIIQSHLASTPYPYRMPEWLTQEDGLSWSKEADDYWRLGFFFDGTTTRHQVEDADMAWKVGRAFGIYDGALSKLSPHKVDDTIIQFHHLPKYLQELNINLKDAEMRRIKTAKHLLESMDQYRYLKDIPFPKNRIIHNDAKISNILFQKEEVYSIIDWDTTMAGHVAWEYGDLIRTSTISVAEDHKEASDIHLRMDLLEGLTAGFKSQIFDRLTLVEKDVLYEGALYLIFEQAVRFLSDYLAGDLYYKCTFDEHNYIRARNQYVILDLLVKDKFAIKQYIGRA